MRLRTYPIAALLLFLVSATAARPQAPHTSELTAAGQSLLRDKLSDSPIQVKDARPDRRPSQAFPLPTCLFPRGLCGAVRSDGSTAVPPRYDWVGGFFEDRAAVRKGALFGFVDELGWEITPPRYRIVDDYKFGYAQVDVDGKSALIDRDGALAFEPKYGFIEAIGDDRFRVSDVSLRGGQIGAEDFTGRTVTYTTNGGVSISVAFPFNQAEGFAVVDRSGRLIEPARTAPDFDKTNLSIRWVEKDKLWGLANPDGTWVMEPSTRHPTALYYGIALVTLASGKVGAVDPQGRFVIAPVFDRLGWFEPGVPGAPAQRDGVIGVIDRSGNWIFQTTLGTLNLASAFSKPDEFLKLSGVIERTRDPAAASQTSRSFAFGWHVEKDRKYGLIGFDGRVVLEPQFDQTVTLCDGGRLQAYKNKEWLYYRLDGSPLQPIDGRLLDASCGAAPPFS
ncbi:MAG: WG repeat-containing protein, partial [Hyphomicrobiaceae bacterium]|nr:WG repeat-containing protein [Hyphomicrobiaceae bacterium]